MATLHERSQALHGNNRPDGGVSHNRTSFYKPLPRRGTQDRCIGLAVYEMEGKNWFALLGILRRHHWGREFALSKAFAETLGWSLPTFKAARTVLVARGLIKCIHPGGRGPKDPPIFRFP